MSLITASAVSLGVAFAMHVNAMTVAPYGAYDNYYYWPGTPAAGRACQSMFILATLGYAFAFLLALTRAFGGSALASKQLKIGSVALSVSKLLKLGSAALAVAGIILFIVGMVIVGAVQFKGLLSYHVTNYTLAAVFALYGGIVALVADSEE